MKYLLLLLPLLFWACHKKNKDDIITKNATFLYMIDPAFGGMRCSHIIRTDDGEVLTPTLITQDKFKRETYRITITYRLTDDYIERCDYDDSGVRTGRVVEVISVKEL